MDEVELASSPWKKEIKEPDPVKLIDVKDVKPVPQGKQVVKIVRQLKEKDEMRLVANVFREFKLEYIPEPIREIESFDEDWTP